MLPDAATPEPEAPEAAPDKREIGLYPKYHVERLDGRDARGGDREDARNGYFVLDTVHDPIARQAYALYALIAEQEGFEAMARDMRHNLRVLGTHISGETTEETKVRVVATWTYPQVSSHAYRERVGYDAANALTADEKAGLDEEGARENSLGLIDFADWADEGSVAFHFSPDA